jgi:hypothetical protein
MYASRGNLARLNYKDIKQLLDRKAIEHKRGTLTNGEIQLLVKEFHNCQTKGKLQQGIAETEMRAMKKKIQHYNVEQLGEVPTEREDGTMKIIVCQMQGCVSPETREIKIAATEKLIQNYDINLYLFMELNFNWIKVNSSANPAQTRKRDKVHHSPQYKEK